MIQGWSVRGVSRETTDSAKVKEGFQKSVETKSKSLGRKSKAVGSEIQIFLFPESGLFNDLQVNPNLCASLLSEPDVSALRCDPQRSRFGDLQRIAQLLIFARTNFPKSIFRPLAPTGCRAMTLGSSEPAIPSFRPRPRNQHPGFMIPAGSRALFAPTNA